METEAARLAVIVAEILRRESPRMEDLYQTSSAVAEALVARGVRITPLDVVEVERARQAGSV